jgi:hypothetical protein
VCGLSTRHWYCVVLTESFYPLHSIKWLDEWMMNWKGCGRKQPWPNLRYYASICMEGLRKTTNNSGHQCWCQMRFDMSVPWIWVNLSTCSVPSHSAQKEWQNWVCIAALHSYCSFQCYNDWEIRVFHIPFPRSREEWWKTKNIKY